jgi:hypothetical protein
MRDGDVVGIERAMDREQPLAVLVLLADRPSAGAAVP